MQRSINRSFCRMVLAAFLCVALALPVFAASGGPFGIALSWTIDPSTSLTVIWRDDAQRTEQLQVVSLEDYDKTGFQAAFVKEADCRDISLDGSGVWHYEATMTGLQPGTAYCCRVGQSDAWSQVFRFTTDDPESKTLTFAYLGDPQTANNVEEDYAAWRELCKAMYQRNPELSFAVSGGDNVNSGISVTEFDAFFEAAQPVFSNVPLFSAVGNHESNFIGGKPKLYLDWFAFPQNGPAGFKEEFYSFDAGNCHILVVNSWIYSGEQKLTDEDYARVAAWIQADLLGSRADWQVVVTHVPMYEVHSDRTATRIREAWGGIFERCGVDLVLEGHQHVYSRSYPLHDGRIDYENGIPYIMGVSGRKFYSSADETLAEKTVYGVSAYQLVHIDGNAMTVQTIDAAGNELDYVSLSRRMPEAVFDDVAKEAWFAGTAAYAYRNRLFQGTGENRFSPESAMTRAMAATVLHRMEGCEAVHEKPGFSDVSPEAWYADGIAWGAENGLFKGYGGGLLGPDDPLTREQVCVLLYRYAARRGLAPESSADLSRFADGDTVSAWARSEVAWAVDAGLLLGTDAGLLRPQATLTRAQAAAMLLRFQMLLLQRPESA